MMKEKMGAIWDGVRESAGAVKDAALLRCRIAGEKADIRDMTVQLGKLALELYDTGKLETPEGYEELKTNCIAIYAKRAAAEALQMEYYARTGRTACRECGRVVHDGYAYCPYCGCMLSTDDITWEEVIPEEDAEGIENFVMKKSSEETDSQDMTSGDQHEEPCVPEEPKEEGESPEN